MMAIDIHVPQTPFIHYAGCFHDLCVRKLGKRYLVIMVMAKRVKAYFNDGYMMAKSRFMTANLAIVKIVILAIMMAKFSLHGDG